MQAKQTIRHEAAVLCKYLVGSEPTERTYNLYAAVISRDTAGPSKTDVKLLQYVVHHPGRIAYLDSALALVRPRAALRQRLYAMFAITEATAEHAQRYLSVSRSPWYVIVVGLVGVRAIYRLAVGLVLLRIVEHSK